MGALETGATVAGYRIESLLGRGGMGIVYRARDFDLERDVALKVIAPELVQDAGIRARFLREARAAAAIEHPHVIPVHAAGEQDGVAFLAMRLVDGDDLRTMVRRDGPPPVARACALVEQAAMALDAIHRAGFVHRDVKPGNLLVDRFDHLYLTDFGLVKQVLTSAPTTHQRLGRNRGLHGARADPRRADRRARRRLLARGRPALPPDRARPVRTRRSGGEAVGAALGGAAAAVGDPSRAPARTRRGRGPRAGEDAGGALPVRGRPRPRGAGRRDGRRSAFQGSRSGRTRPMSTRARRAASCAFIRRQAGVKCGPRSGCRHSDCTTEAATCGRSCAALTRSPRSTSSAGRS